MVNMTSSFMLHLSIAIAMLVSLPEGIDPWILLSLHSKWATKKPENYFPLYWLVYRNPDNGLL